MIFPKRISKLYVLATVVLSLIVLSSFTERGNAVIDKLMTLPQLIYSVPKADTQASFAGEVMPKNMDTRERLDRELTVNSYYHSNTLLSIKTANKYFPIMEQILRRQGVPEDFKYLSVIESSLRNVTSPAGAKGLWQIMKGTGKELGLEINSEVDERYHLEKSTTAAARYLKRLYDRFGSWTLAAAAYNMGPGNLSKALKNQGGNSYYDLNINEETSRYIFRLLAVKQIMSNPSQYGFYVNKEDLYEPMTHVYTVEINKSVPSWAIFAKEHGVSYKILKYYNPWLRDNKLTVKNNKYLVKIPRR